MDTDDAAVKAEVEKQRIRLLNLATTVRDILRDSATESLTIKRKQKKVESSMVTQAKDYITSLKSANCIVKLHHKYFIELYNNYDDEILETKQSQYWLEHNVVILHFCHDNQFAAKKYILRLSNAFCVAKKIRKELDKEVEEQDNPNDKAEIKDRYRYRYQEELLFRLLEVFADCLAKEDRDRERLESMADYFKSKTRWAKHDSSSDEDAQSGASGLADAFGRMMGAGGNVPSGKDLSNILLNMTSDERLIKNFEGAVEVAQSFNVDGKFDSKKAPEMMRAMSEVMAPVVGDTIDMVMGKKDEDKDKDSKEIKEGKSGVKTTTVEVSDSDSESEEKPAKAIKAKHIPQKKVAKAKASTSESSEEVKPRSVKSKPARGKKY